uniref:Glycine reductase n=4 Tax=Hirondellea gigas TaxID=1518452 RepID=A0A6A7GAJ2_9CRUS
MNFAVLKGAAYCLVHTPDMIEHNGTTQTVEKLNNPKSDYLKNIRDSYRTYEEVVNYGPNQTYIGNMTPKELKEIGMPFVGKHIEGATNKGKFGEILAQKEFIIMIKLADVFDLVLLEETFLADALTTYRNYEFYSESEESHLKKSYEFSIIEALVNEDGAEGLYHENKLVGCVKRAHDIDTNLSSHVIFENLVVKASGILAFKNLIARNNIDPTTIDYVIECSEEACGDMNQRGGGNFAKAIAEAAGAINATGSDLRGFCAAPTHSLITAASLVKAGTYKNVVIVAGGASAKLGMNGKDHVKKGFPILEDTLGAFALLISQNDGVSPVINTDFVGRHTVGTGSSPQAVITSLVIEPLERAGLKITDVDKYSVEMQNPDVTKPAGAGDVPEGNYKMIGACGVKKGHIEKKDMKNFVINNGMVGWAPTQGHIPSGVPYLGFAMSELTTGNLNRIMVVGKGSLFLGRMTNLFDGVSIMVERNKGITEEAGKVSKDEINMMIAEAMRNFASQFLG